MWGRRIFFLISLLLALTLITPVHSSPTLFIDGSGSNNCSGVNSCTSSPFSTSNPNDVVIVFAISTSPSFSGLPTASPTGLSFTVRLSTTFSSHFVGEWWAIASTTLVGETVTVTATLSGKFTGLVVWGISGANTANPFDPSLSSSPATSSGTTPHCSCSVPISVTIPSTSNANDMILGMAGIDSTFDTFSAGSGGFTLIAVGPTFAGAEFKVVSSTQSSLSVPITLNHDGLATPWVMFGDAVQAATTPPIPEYPYGLPLLAIFTVLAYGVIRRKARN